MGRRTWLLLALGAVTLLGFMAGPLAADDEDGPTPAPAPKDEPAPDDAPVRPEIHKLYVPFKNLKAIFEKEGEGVFLPYPEFRNLWDRAHEKPKDLTQPPVAAAVRSAQYAGTVEGDTIRFEATVEVEVLADGWQRVPFNFRGVGVESATIDGEPALLVPTKAGYDLLLRDKGRRTVKLAMQVSATRKGETRLAAFHVPPVPLARMTLSMPGGDAEISVSPRLAFTSHVDPAGRTQMLAFLGPVSKVELSWHRKQEDGPTVAPLVFAEQRIDVRVDRGIVRTHFEADLAIHRAPLERLEVAVPPDAVVLSVEADGLRSWRPNETNDRIAIELREPARKNFSLRIGLERPLAAPPTDAVLPLAALEGMERERGFLRIRAAEGVRVEPRVVQGLMQVDDQDLPKALRGGAPGRTIAYRFPARPPAPTVRMSLLEPRVTVALGNRVAVRPEALDVVTLAHLTVERTGIFDVSFHVPKVLEVTDVHVQGVALDDWALAPSTDAPDATLHLKFSDRLLGKAVVRVHARAPLTVPDTEGEERLLAVPLLRLQAANHVRGFLGVHVDAALDRRIANRTGLTVLDEGAAAALEPPALQGPAAATPLVYRFEHREDDIALQLAVQRKAATVTCAVQSWAKLEPDRTSMAVTLRYQVAYRGIDTFRFLAPLDLEDRLHLDVPGMQLLGPEPEEKPEGAPQTWRARRGIWTVRLPGPRMGAVPVALSLDDLQEETLTSGGSRATSLPTFVPLEVEGKPLPNTVHHAAVRRDPLLEVEAGTLSQAEEIDARELPDGLRHPDNFLAFRSYAPEHTIDVTATRHDYEPVAEVVISHMHLDTVVHEQGRAITEAYLIVRNNDRQYLEVALPGKATIRALRVGGKVEPPRVGAPGTVLIPILSGRAKDEAFEVAFVYEHDVDRRGWIFQTVEAASPTPKDASYDLLTWRVFLPDDRVYTSFGGSVFPDAPRHTWASNWLRHVGSKLYTRPKGRKVDVSALLDRFESPFRTMHEPRMFAFQGRVGTGTVAVHHVSPTAFALVRLIALLLGFLAALVLTRLVRRAGYGAAPVVAALVLFLFALLVPASYGWGQVLTAMLVGVLAYGLVALVRWVAHARATRPELVPDLPATPAEGGAA